MNDENCETNGIHGAYWIQEQIGERVQSLRMVPWATHGYWGGPLSNSLYKELEERLINPEKKTKPYKSQTV